MTLSLWQYSDFERVMSVMKQLGLWALSSVELSHTGAIFRDLVASKEMKGTSFDFFCRRNDWWDIGDTSRRRHGGDGIPSRMVNGGGGCCCCGSGGGSSSSRRAHQLATVQVGLEGRRWWRHERWSVVHGRRVEWVLLQTLVQMVMVMVANRMFVHFFLFQKENQFQYFDLDGMLLAQLVVLSWGTEPEARQPGQCSVTSHRFLIWNTILDSLVV